jgi:hypothetical protein
MSDQPARIPRRRRVQLLVAAAIVLLALAVVGGCLYSRPVPPWVSPPRTAAP